MSVGEFMRSVEEGQILVRNQPEHGFERDQSSGAPYKGAVFATSGTCTLLSSKKESLVGAG